MQFNESLYNTGLWGTDGTIAPVYSTDLAVFDDFSFSDGTTYTVTRMTDNGPSRDIIGGDVPRDHGRFITGDFFREKEIEFQGYIRAADAASLLTAMDNLKKALRKRERHLDITQGSIVRRYVATVVNFDDIFSGKEGYHVNFCPFTVRFACKTPFAMDRDYTATTITLSSSPQTLAVYNLGTAVAYPIVTLIFDSASSVTAVNLKRIEPSDGSTLDEIECSPAGGFAASSVLVFDSEQKTVQKDSAAVDYTGSFPTLEPGSNLLQFTITGTSFSAPTTERHKNAYL